MPLIKKEATPQNVIIVYNVPPTSWDQSQYFKHFVKAEDFKHLDHYFVKKSCVQNEIIISQSY